MSKRFVPNAVRWFGGKGNMLGKIVPLIDAFRHTTYVELFAGGAAVLIQKRFSPVEVYNDLDEGLVGFFRVLSSREHFEEFQKIVSVLPVSRKLWRDFRDEWSLEKDPIQKAAKWFVVARQSFSGCFGKSWGFARGSSYMGMAGVCSNWLSCLEGLERLHWRLVRVQIECDDFRKILKNYDSLETLFYCDPPYIHTTRMDGEYAHEMTDKDHKEFLEKLLSIEGSAIISGYPSALYSGMLRNTEWKEIRFETVCYAAARTRGTGILGVGSAIKKQKRTEVLWLSPRVVPVARKMGYDVQDIQNVVAYSIAKKPVKRISG